MMADYNEKNDFVSFSPSLWVKYPLFQKTTKIIVFVHRKSFLQYMELSEESVVILYNWILSCYLNSHSQTCREGTAKPWGTAIGGPEKFYV